MTMTTFSEPIVSKPVSDRLTNAGVKTLIGAYHAFMGVGFHYKLPGTIPQILDSLASLINIRNASDRPFSSWGLTTIPRVPTWHCPRGKSISPKLRPDQFITRSNPG